MGALASNIDLVVLGSEEDALIGRLISGVSRHVLRRDVR